MSAPSPPAAGTAVGPFGPNADTPEVGPSETDQYFAAVDHYRDVAKWLVAVFGAIGVVIAGTAPFADLDKTPADRLGFVVAGGAIALVGVSVVLAATVAVLVPLAVHRHELRSMRQRWFRRTFVGLGKLETLLAEHPEDVMPPGLISLRELDQAIENLRRQTFLTRVATNELAFDDPARAAHERAVEAMSASLSRHRLALRRLLIIARFEKARTRFNLVLAAVLSGGVAAATGLGLMLYGLGNSEDAPPPPAVDAHAEPSRMTMAPDSLRCVWRGSPGAVDGVADRSGALGLLAGHYVAVDTEGVMAASSCPSRS